MTTVFTKETKEEFAALNAILANAKAMAAMHAELAKEVHEAQEFLFQAEAAEEINYVGDESMYAIAAYEHIMNLNTLIGA
jgi:hypothetical protein